MRLSGQFVNASLTKLGQSDVQMRRHRRLSRQLYEEAGGISPAGFVSEIPSIISFGHICPMPKPINDYEREVRRTRNIQASIKVQDRTLAECRVMDISHGGAKISTTGPSLVPDRFELAFAEGDQIRSCEVIWRHGKICGVKFAL